MQAQPELFGPVVSDPTVSRLIAALAADIDVSLPASPWSPSCGGATPPRGTKDDHLTTLDLALVQLPDGGLEPVLVRADSGACSGALLHHITSLGLEY